MAEKIIRVVRMMEYVGPREWVEETLKRGAVPANGVKSFGNGEIRSSACAEVMERRGSNAEN